MLKDDLYVTKDLSESAALLALGQKIIKIDKVEGICWFNFSNKSKCKEISNSFWFDNCFVDAKSYYDSIVKLKNRIFSS